MVAKNFTEIGINFSAFSNVSFPEFSALTNQSGQEFVQSIPVTANSITDGYYGIITLIVMGIWLIWMLSDQTQFGLFRYSSIRALAITLGIMLTFGINMVQIGFMTSFIHITILTTFFTIIFIYIVASNPS